MNKYGLIVDTKRPEDYIFGGGFIGTKEINPNGDWSGFLVTEETQNLNGVETMACTTFGTHNCIEILMNFLFHIENNYSERYTSILAGTQITGNSPKTIIQTIKNKGVIPEIDLPFSKEIDSWEKFYNPYPVPKNLLSKGNKWLEEYSIQYEWVFDDGLSVAKKHDLISLALKRSPVGMSVYAWGSQDENGIYQQDGKDNHWVCCYGLDDQGNYKIFDSYSNTHKVYSKNSNVSMAMLYWITKSEKKERLGLLARIFNFFTKK